VARDTPWQGSDAKGEKAQAEHRRMRSNQSNLQGDPDDIPRVQRKMQQVERRVLARVPEERRMRNQQCGDERSGGRMRREIREQSRGPVDGLPP
jgi:hypothetical protein